MGDNRSYYNYTHCTVSSCHTRCYFYNRSPCQSSQPGEVVLKQCSPHNIIIIIIIIITLAKDEINVPIALSAFRDKIIIIIMKTIY